MKNWLQRVIATFLFSAGLACLVFPFRDYKIERVEIKVARADAIGVVEKPTDLWEPDPEKVKTFPAEVLKTLNDDSFTGTRTLRKPGKNVSTFFPTENFKVANNSFFLIHRDRLFKIQNQAGYQVNFAKKYGAQVSDDVPEIVHVTVLGKLFPSDAGIAITSESIRAIPALRYVFESSVMGDFLPFETWREFAKSGETRAVYNGRLFEITPAEELVEQQQKVAGLRTAKIVFGGCGVLVGLILLARLYRQKSGIEGAVQIGTPGLQIAGDAVTVVIATVAMVPLLDAFLHRSFGVETIADEEFGRLMGGFFLAVGVPAAALYLSTIGAQWFAVDDETIHLKSLLSDRSIAWADLESVESQKSHIGTARAGVPLARTLQKSLVFLSVKSERVAVMEPTKGVKRTILAQLEKHAPDEWKAPLEAAGKEWLRYESW